MLRIIVTWFVAVRDLSYNEGGMGFKDVKAQVLGCIGTGNVQHQVREEIDTKNLLLTGQVTVEEVSDAIRRSRGSDYECSPHHVIRGIDVHIIKASYQGKKWYIKWYFIEPNTIFISVHH